MLPSSSSQVVCAYPPSYSGGDPGSALSLDSQPTSGKTLSVLTFFGIGRGASRARRSLVLLLWNLALGFAQFIGIITVLFLVKLYLKSPRNPSISEWDACDRPLGLWAVLWLIRVVLASSLSYWEYRRDRQRFFPNGFDIENADNTPSSLNQPQTSQGSSLPHTYLYSKITFFSSVATLIWFVIGNVWVYTSINTCRHTSPRLWWLDFTVLVKMYSMVLEVVIIGFVVFIATPIFHVFWDFFLFCIGRHSTQNPGEIGKLPKPIVDRIPLVTYIPLPPNLLEAVFTTPLMPKKERMAPKLLPKLPIFRSKSSNAKTSHRESGNEIENAADAWKDEWELGEYPSITLAGNRAICAICLNDFEAPRRKADNTTEEKPSDQEQRLEKASTPMETATVKVPIVDVPTPGLANKKSGAMTERGTELSKLQDTGTGAQPLRLLGCTHVFHRTCIDPWLTEVSGRCPICQRAVEPTKPYKSRRL